MLENILAKLDGLLGPAESLILREAVLGRLPPQSLPGQLSLPLPGLTLGPQLGTPRNWWEYTLTTNGGRTVLIDKGTLDRVNGFGLVEDHDNKTVILHLHIPVAETVGLGFGEGLRAGVLSVDLRGKDAVDEEQKDGDRNPADTPGPSGENPTP